MKSVPWCGKTEGQLSSLGGQGKLLEGLPEQTLNKKKKKQQPSKEKLKDSTGRGSSIKKDVRGIKKHEVHGKPEQFAWVEHKVWEQDTARRSR